MRSNQVTIKDIARELGISPSTVSRALKDHPDISPETKREVNDLAKRLRYQPNAVALSLKHSKRFTIGVIIPETVHYFFSTVISGIEDVAYEAGYNVMICQSNERYDREVSNAQMLFSNRVDGVLVSVAKETNTFNHLTMFPDGNVPLVFFDRSVEEIDCDKIIIDDYRAAYIATSHLIEHGHTRLVHLAAPQNLQIGIQRKQGFIDALKAHNLPADEATQVLQADKFEMGCAIVESLDTSQFMPDGICAVNDLTALGAMQALKNHKLRIPEDIGLVGFSNGQYSYLTDPPLTTIDQNGYEMGKIAATLLLKRIESDEDSYIPETHLVETTLIVRNSTKP